ncbi:radical SAM protein, partial [candidate division KSB1 bacterium]|nr:radical SAM protein [candidate division KSB1 bacterium]
MNNRFEKYQYLFGPVPSRRLGYSLGIDVIPLKTCTQNCIYCELGIDQHTTIQRKAYVPVGSIMGELKKWLELNRDADIDYFTITGSGEPTLNNQLGILIDEIQKITKIPTAILTNGTLLSDPQVRKDCSKAEVVLPSLDAPNRDIFNKINRPNPELNFESFVNGLKLFREEYSGQIWLELFFLEGYNTDPDSIKQFRHILDIINPDKIQLNTYVRPGTDPDLEPVSFEKLQEIATSFGSKAEVIAGFKKSAKVVSHRNLTEKILETLKRRPCG